MTWTLTVSDLNVTASEDEVGEAVNAIAAILEGRGHQGFTLSIRRVSGTEFLPVRRTTYVGACSQCGGSAGLHALSCSHYPGPGNAEPFQPLTDFVLKELRTLPPYQWYAWPPTDYDEGLPVVEIRQDHLAALLAEVQEARHGR